MPELKTVILSLMAQTMIASTAWGLAQPRISDICDQAARRAAQAQDVPLDILFAIARVETGRIVDGRFRPWPWTVNVEGKGFWFGSESEAKTYVFDVFKAGARSFDIGCFQINYRWHGKAFRSIDAMFDPDQNATYAAKLLKELYVEHGSWPRAVGAYHSRTPDLARTYVARFQTILADLGDRPAPTTRQGLDPFHRAALPLIPVHPAQLSSRTGALGSLVPTTGSATAFIAFSQE